MINKIFDEIFLSRFLIETIEKAKFHRSANFLFRRFRDIVLGLMKISSAGSEGVLVLVRDRMAYREKKKVFFISLGCN